MTEVIIVSAEPAHHFDQATTEALKTWKFRGGDGKYVGEVTVNFSQTE